MSIPTNQLLHDLAEIVREILYAVETELYSLPVFELNIRPASDSWSVAECLQHLNLYGKFYLPVIQKAIFTAQKRGYSPTAKFIPGRIGQYFADTIRVRETISKMKSPKNMLPEQKIYTHEVLAEFMTQGQRTLELLHQAKTVDLNRSRTRIALFPMIRLRLGDTLRFFVYHMERHALQALQASKTMYPMSMPP